MKQRSYNAACALYTYFSLGTNVARHRKNLQCLIIGDDNGIARCFTELTNGSDQAVREWAQEAGGLVPLSLAICSLMLHTKH